MVRIRMRRSVVGENGKDWHVGDEHEATPAFARHLLDIGAAEHAVAGAALPAPPPLTYGELHGVPSVPAVENRMASAETRDPKPRGKK